MKFYTAGCIHNCSGHGKCRDPRFDMDASLVSPECICFSNWSGDDCSIEDVNHKKCQVDCGEHGKCIENKCVCEEWYRGVDCKERFCPNDCSFHGKVSLFVKYE